MPKVGRGRGRSPRCAAGCGATGGACEPRLLFSSARAAGIWQRSGRDDLVPELRAARRFFFSAGGFLAGGDVARAAGFLACARAHRRAGRLARGACDRHVRLCNARPACSRCAAAYGAAFGLFPIGWIVLNAIFIYDLSVETGQFEMVKRQIAGVSGDRRIQALLIAFSFGAFIEGAAGFGAPVAISGALMIGLGFRPLEAAKLALIGNTAPVAFGSLGMPLITLARRHRSRLQELSAMVGRQLPFFSLIVPFWLVAAQAGWRGMIEVWPACLVAG